MYFIFGLVLEIQDGLEKKGAVDIISEIFDEANALITYNLNGQQMKIEVVEGETQRPEIDTEKEEVKFWTEVYSGPFYDIWGRIE